MHLATFEQPLPKRFQPFMSNGYQSTANDAPVPFEIVEPAPAGAGSVSGTDMGRFMLAYLNGGNYERRHDSASQNDRADVDAADSARARHPRF